MTFSSPQLIRTRAGASILQAQTAFWFPVLPGLQALPSTPTITINADPAPANAVPVPVGFNEDNPDLADLFENILPRGLAPLHPKTMDVVAGLLVPPYNEIQTWEARIRVGAEVVLLPFSNEIVLAAAATLRLPDETFLALPSEGGSSLTLVITSITAGRVRIAGTTSATLTVTGTTAGTVRTPSGSVATLTITGTAAGGVRVTGTTSATLAVTGTAAGTNSTPAAYRYWRITSLSLFNPANFLQLAEIEYATDNTGSIVSRPSDGASAATAYLSPDGGGVVANVNDNNTATDAAWGSSRWSDSLFHITIDMGSARTITHWRQRWTGVFGSGLSGLTVQASNTAGSGYVTIEVLSGLSNPGADTYSSWIQIQ
jgi:hypothetical protein